MLTINCVKVADHLYVGVTTLDDLRRNCMNPMEVAKSTERQRAASAELRDAWRQRGDLQRQFGKARTQRAVDYAHYIAAVSAGERTGGYPPITLWTTDAGKFDPRTGMLAINSTSVVTASDGETQLAARYMLAYGFTGDGFMRPIMGDRVWLDQPFAVTISTKSSKGAAMQTLHDLNTYATPIKETETAPLNVEGALTKAVNAGIAKAKFDPTLIKNKSRMSVNSVQPVSMLTLLHGAIGVVNGTEALLHSSPPTWLAEGNRPYATANGREAMVADFIVEVLALPSFRLREIDFAHMLALGVYYQHHRAIHSMTQDEITAVIEAVRVAGNRKRVTTRAAANAIYDFMHRNPVMQAAE